MKSPKSSTRIAGIVLSVLFIFFFVSCEKEYYVQSLEIFNATDSNFDIYLYPKSTYKINDNIFNYYIDDTTKTGGISSKIEVDTTWSSNSVIFTHDLESTPSELLNKVFDSIKIEFRESSLILLFRPGSASGYQKNIFDPEINWELKSVEYPAECTMHCPNVYYYESKYAFYVYDSLIKKPQY